VESEPGRGTTFSFTANFGLGKEKAKKRFKPATELSGMKVLVVDDNATSRSILQEMLESFSFEVSLAASGEEGITELENADECKPFELVIMDWQMPGMDGHVTKPIDPDQLFATLQKWILPSEKQATSQKPVALAVASGENKVGSIEEELPELLPSFDLADGLKRLRGNKKFYRKLLLNFATDYCEVANEISAALDADDFVRAHSLVHNLKGLAGNLAATDLQAAAVNLEKLVKGIDKKAAPSKQRHLRLSVLETALNQALESLQSLRVSAEEGVCKLSDEENTAIPAEFAQDIAKRIRDAAEMGDVRMLNAIAEEITTHSNSCVPLSKQIVQMAEDFDLDIDADSVDVDHLVQILKGKNDHPDQKSAANAFGRTFGLALGNSGAF